MTEGTADRGDRGELEDLAVSRTVRATHHPRHGVGSAWGASAWYGYVSKDLRALSGEPVEGAWHRSYRGDGSLAECRTALRGSLAAAVARARAAQDGAPAADLTYDKHTDDIVSTAAGLIGVRPIDWQNRPTLQQAVTFHAHRPR
ncbi:MAG: hypothetical protein GEV11_28875 [Streptosporangiales bacterium]|nr:hypothetical protein [Streptosporangiales bacterium]